MTEILFHFGRNIKGKSLLVSGMRGDESIFTKFTMNNDTKQSK